MSVHTCALRELVGFRSGDKANLVNVALFADTPELFAHLCSVITAERISEHLAIPSSSVACFPAENVLGINIVIQNALGGGGPATLFGDNLGKSFASRILDLEVELPADHPIPKRPRPDVGWATDLLHALPQA